MITKLKRCICNPVSIVSLKGKIAFFFFSLEENLSSAQPFVSVPRERYSMEDWQDLYFWRIFLVFGGSAIDMNHCYFCDIKLHI